MRVRSLTLGHNRTSAAIRDSSPQFQQFSAHREETSQRFWSFAMPMKLERQTVAALELDSMDRQVIRVDVPAGHAGIAAALRRAFEAAASEPSNRDFAELLRRLN